MIKADQIRAARALANWSQGELAKRIGLSTPAVGNIEIEKHKPTLETQTKIINAFGEANIEFIDDGVRRKQDKVLILEGDDCYLKLLDLVFYELKGKDSDFLLSCCDDKRCSNAVIDKTRFMRKNGIKMRHLIEEGNNYFLGKPEEYRWIDPYVYSKGDVKVIFADYIGYGISWENSNKVILIHDHHIADESRRLFNFLWNHSKKPIKSSAPFSYEE